MLTRFTSQFGRCVAFLLLVNFGMGCGESEADKRLRAELEKRSAESQRENERIQKLQAEEAQKKQAMKDRLDAILSEAKSLPALKVQTTPPPVGLQGKAVVLAKDGSVHPVSAKLPEWLRGSPDDHTLVFLIVDSYGMRGKQTYKLLTKQGEPESRTIPSMVQVVEVRIIDVKAKKVLGTFKAVGAEPSALTSVITSRPGDPAPISGPDPDLVAWITERCTATSPP